jgi:hypothetical protein
VKKKFWLSCLLVELSSCRVVVSGFELKPKNRTVSGASTLVPAERLVKVVCGGVEVSLSNEQPTTEDTVFDGVTVGVKPVTIRRS